LIYENPVTLPCGNSLCKHHLDESCDDKFMCQFCKEDHLIPKNGFGISKTITELIEVNVQFNYLRSEMKQTFDSLDGSIEGV